MPRKAASVPRKSRTPKAPAGFSETPRLLSGEEKHRLIMAHAAARAPSDPLQRVSLWAGVTLSVAAIAAGWWFTVGEGVQQSVSQSSLELQAAAAQLDKFTNLVQTSPLLNNPAGSPTSNANAASFNEVMRNNLFGDATRTRDLLSPVDDSATSASASTAIINPSGTPSQPPSTPPGLTPDP